jgi:hypothetical protein
MLFLSTPENTPIFSHNLSFSLKNDKPARPEGKLPLEHLE